VKLIKPIIRSTVLVIFLIITVACTSTTVHVNKLYLNEQESQKITIELKKLGLDVEFNELNFPTDISSTSILYSPFVKDKKAVNKIEDTLTRLGYGASNISALVASNHWYTKNTVGLFIVPDGIAPNSGKNIEDIAFHYQSEKCDNLTELNLQKNGKFTYKIFDDIKITGTWSITGYPYILLENKEPYLHYYFEIKRSKKVDKISEIEIIDLQPVSSSLIILNCKLTYGERI
jgi:hypothetical protein